MKKTGLILLLGFVLTAAVWAQEPDFKQIMRDALEGVPAAQTDLGYMYFHGQGVKQDYAKGIEWYKKAAVQNDIYGQYNLGIIFDAGEGVPQDLAEAFKWYKLAAEGGLPHAQHNVANMYQFGDGVERDYAKALLWYEKAAENDYAPSQYNLGRMYYEGLGTEVDYVRAFAWLGSARSNGDEKAMEMLEEMSTKMTEAEKVVGNDLLERWLDEE